MALENVSIEERFRRLCIAQWHYARTHPRVGDETQHMLAQLPPERFVRDVAPPMRRYIRFYVSSHLATHEQADDRIWRILSREGLERLCIVLAGVFTLSALALYNGASVFDLIRLFTLIFMGFGPALLLRTLLVKTNVITGIQNTLIKKIFHLDNRDWKVGVVLGSIRDLYSLTHATDERLTKNKDIIKEVLKFLLQTKEGRKENFTHDFTRRTEEIQTDILLRFFDEIALPRLKSQLEELLEASMRALALLHELLSSLVSKWTSVSTPHESRQVARSFGGIASEVATLANLIMSLALISADRTPSWSYGLR
jgi:hypothetical protein